MMDFRPPEWCIVRDNSKLRKMLEYRVRERGINATLEKAGIDKRNFYKFIKGYSKELSQRDVVKLCDVVDIKLTFDATFL